MKHFPRETKLDFDEVLNLYFQGKLFFKNFGDAVYQDLFWNRLRNVYTKFSKNLQNWTTAFEQLNDTFEETLLTQV